MPEKNNQNKTREQKIEAFLIDPEKTIFETLTEFESSISMLTSLLENVDIDSLEKLEGQDGETPVRGEQYWTEEDLETFEQFINSKIPQVGKEVPSVEQVETFIKKQVSKIKSIKGEPGTPAKPAKPGEPGKNGSPDTGADIIAKIRSVKKNAMLKITDVRGLQKVLTSLTEGVDSIDELQKRVDDFKYVVGPNGTGSSLNIVYSDTEPISPADGDLWIDTSVRFDLPVTSAEITSIVALTQVEYDALTLVTTTLYYITDA